MSKDVKTIDFYGQEIETFEHEGERYVIAKTVCEGMGLDWTNQQRKLVGGVERFNYSVIAMVAKDGRTREQGVVPIDRLDAWLFSINPNRVREDLRQNIIQYQSECAQALHNYWNKGVAINPRIGSPEWQAKREEGISSRNHETDIIQVFIEYAREQGSKNSEHYYQLFTRATYKGLELIQNWRDDCRDLREKLEIDDLAAVSMAEIRIREIIAEGMQEDAYYKDIYSAARDVVIDLNAFRKRKINWHLKVVK